MRQRLARWIALAIIANYAVLVAIYVSLDVYYHEMEAGIVSVTALFARGEPLYRSVTDAIQATYAYGPSLFVFGALSVIAFGSSIFAVKLPAAIFGLLSVCGLWAAIRTRLDRDSATFGAALLILMYCLLGPFVNFGTRPDAYILGSVGLGLWGAVLRIRFLSVGVLALAIGIAMNAKIHAGVYFLPALVLLSQAHGVVSLLGVILGSLIVFFAPFTLTDLVSLPVLLERTRIWASTGFALDDLMQRIGDLVVYLLLPAASVRLLSDKPLLLRGPLRLYLLALGITTVVALAMSLHVGSARNQLVPLALPLTFWIAHDFKDSLLMRQSPTGQTTRTSMRLWLTYALVFLMLTKLVSINVYMGVLLDRNTWLAKAFEDVAEVQRRYPNEAIQIGYADGSYSDGPAGLEETVRPLLVLSGHPYLIDPWAAMDLNIAGVETPPATLAKLRECMISIWMIPRGGEPFIRRDGLSGVNLFDNKFRTTFLESYEYRYSLQRFNLWFCRR